MTKPKGFMVDGVEVDANGRPLSEPAPAPADAAAGQELLQANADLKADLDKAVAERDRLESVNGGLSQQLEEMTRIADRQADGWAEATRRYEVLGEQLDAARAELETAQREGNEAQAQVATLSEQLKAAQAKALPDDAETRLVEVKGIGESLAKQAIAALTAPAQK